MHMFVSIMVLKSLRMVVSWQCCRKRFRPRKKTKCSFKLYILRSLGRPRLIALVTREAATGTESQDFVTHSHKTAHHALSLLFPSLSDCSLFVVCFKTRKTPHHHANALSSFVCYCCCLLSLIGCSSLYVFVVLFTKTSVGNAPTVHYQGQGFR